MIGYTVYKVENILYIGTSKFFVTFYIRLDQTFGDHKYLHKYFLLILIRKIKKTMLIVSYNL